ncbi:MAG: DUF4215 domain-containing protein [Nanoarchaeota archaeon]|nr:DUF4215 domain-containing protein [Nanoarchaeota archaeon]MBU1644328.1 DUF4215 domain-containing protein [Nanoarchaeota archaeon]MBU1976349.1 DUF4215 domain-containing protein [Nanoarchaeota archaeon]
MQKKIKVLLFSGVLTVFVLFLVGCTPKLSDQEVVESMLDLSEEEVDAVVAEDSAIAGQVFSFGTLKASNVNLIRQSYDLGKQPSCSETDLKKYAADESAADGFNIYVKGTTTSSYGNVKRESVDVCKSDTKVTEFYCYKGTSIFAEVSCPKGYLCKDGACNWNGLCGDLKVEEIYGETCDDGNTDNGDGCSSTCKIEWGWNCEKILKGGPQWYFTGECLPFTTGASCKDIGKHYVTKCTGVSPVSFGLCACSIEGKIVCGLPAESFYDCDMAKEYYSNYSNMFHYPE